MAKWRRWLVFRDGVYVEDDGDVLVTGLAKEVGVQLYREAAEIADSKDRHAKLKLAEKALSKTGIIATLHLARDVEGILIDHNDLDADPWLFGVANGVVGLRTGTLRNATPDDLLMRRSRIAFDPEAVAPLWEEVLRQWQPSEAIRGYIQRLAGSALVGSQRDHIFVILFGVGRNGKGTFVRALLHVFDAYGLTADLSLIVQQKHEGPPSAKADLFRRRLAVAAETDRRAMLAEANIKTLTGGDTVKARRLYQDQWEFAPSHHLWLQTNYLPQISGRDRGVWSRVRVVPWDANFEGQEDRDLDEKLRAEAPGILAWLVRGCLEWQRRGLDEPEEVRQATAKYRKSEDSLARFADECGVAFGSGLSVPVAALNEITQQWSADVGVRVSKKLLVEWLIENGAKQLRDYDVSGQRIRIWSGVGIIERPRDRGDNSAQDFLYTRTRENSWEELSHLSQDRGEAWDPDETQLSALDAEGSGI